MTPSQFGGPHVPETFHPFRTTSGSSSTNGSLFTGYVEDLQRNLTMLTTGLILLSTALIALRYLADIPIDEQISP